MENKLINFQEGWAGVFAKLNMYIVACKEAERLGYLPVPYWPSIWHTEDIDIWDIFFERIGHSQEDKQLPLEEINIAKLFAKRERDKQVNPAPQFAGVLREPTDRQECHHIIDEVNISLQPWLKKQIQNLYDQHFKSRRVLGVHLRGPGKDNGLFRVEGDKKSQYLDAARLSGNFMHIKCIKEYSSSHRSRRAGQCGARRCRQT